MKLKIVKSAGTIIFVVNIVFVAGLLVSGFSYLVDPAKCPYATLAGMSFPLFLAVNLLFLVFWLIFKPRRALLAFAAFVVCYNPARMYIGIHPAGETPAGAIKVMTYNTLNFTGLEYSRLDHRDNPIVYYLVDADADILCLQECLRTGLSPDMHQLLYDKYPYHHFTDQGRGGTSLAVYTKYPILKVDSIPCDTCSNISVAYTLALPKGYAIVVNNHFESNKFEPDKVRDFRSMMLGEMRKDSARMESKYIFSRLMEMSKRRSAQVKAVAEYVKLNQDVPLILCGDFNDMPISHNYYALARLLTDCFRASGLGFGWTYAHNGMRVRIDNIMCSGHFVPHACKVLTEQEYSDHYPVVCWLTYKEDGKEEGDEP
ncbi:MAG: endonuclease/exonuclease/phosphatase family protein [Prevotella sp.]|nr:endonuclease/exonuclease/phosphatase family protein [Prevotella sp.]